MCATASIVMRPQLFSAATASLAWAVAWCATDWRDATIMTLVGACALAQHLTESVDDCAPLIVTPFPSSAYRVADRVVASAMAIWSFPKIVRPAPTFEHWVIGSIALAMLGMCDAGVFSGNAVAYSLVHSLWHVQIYAFTHARLCAVDAWANGEDRERGVAQGTRGLTRLRGRHAISAADCDS